MAVWLYAYGHNGLGNYSVDKVDVYRDILNSTELDELQILGSVYPPDRADWVKEYYNRHREVIEIEMRSKSHEEYQGYLASIHMPYVPIDGLVDRYIEDAEKRAKENKKKYDWYCQQYQTQSLKSSWELEVQSTDFARFRNTLGYYKDRHDGLVISIYNDVIWVSGPFDIFSKYFYFQKDISIESRNYYHSLFSRILRAFGSEFIFYSHEWAMGEDDESNVISNVLLDLMSTVATSSSIHDMEDYYYEKL